MYRARGSLTRRQRRRRHRWVAAEQQGHLWGWQLAARFAERSALRLTSPLLFSVSLPLPRHLTHQPAACQRRCAAPPPPALHAAPLQAAAAAAEQRKAAEAEQRKREEAEAEEKRRKAEAAAWGAYKSAEGAAYYYNTLTGESSWERPEGFEGDASKASAQPTPVSTGESRPLGSRAGICFFC